MAPMISAQFAPLAACYASGIDAMPVPTIIDGPDMPEQYRRLLVHLGDMTLTLERFYGSRMKVRVLGSRHVRDEYHRQVVLCDDQGAIVEFGAICIHFDVVTPSVFAQVLAGVRPLGGLLSEQHVPYSSKPTCFFSMVSDLTINQAFGLTGSRTVYGRCNTLLDHQGRSIADIVEILPPSPPAERG